MSSAVQTLVDDIWQTIKGSANQFATASGSLFKHSSLNFARLDLNMLALH